MEREKLPWYERAWEKAERFIQFFNGKKNKIGNAALACYGVMESATMLGLIPEHTVVGQVVLIGGIAFKLLGISHKAIKGEIEMPAGLSKTSRQ